jgi:hypothetical protein
MSVATVVLDNEAVQALLDERHRKHRRILAILTEANRRNLRQPGRVSLIVPTPVRVEAGWDRTAASAANANRISGARDHELDGPAADRAANISKMARVTVVDACVGQALEAAAQPVAVVTSDVKDMTRIRDTGEAADVRILPI